MKKITLLVFLMITSLAIAQQQEYHLDFESDNPSGVAATWSNAFGGTSVAEIITNPDPDGTNTSATTQVLKTTLASPTTAEFWAGIDNAASNSVLGTWKIDMSVASNLTLTMDINKNYVGTIGIKMATSSNATTFEIGNQNVDNAIVDEWQTLTFDLSGINPNGDLTDINKMIVFVDYTKTDGRVNGPSEYVLLIDNIKWNAEKLSDAPEPTCTDGFQNGDETGVDCGGSSCNACLVDPTTSAPSVQVTGTAGTDYISIYSDDLTNISVGNLNPNWGQATQMTEIDINGNNTLKYANLNYQGTDFNGDKQDVSAMTHFHLDYFTYDSSALQFFLINNDTEIAYDIQADLGLTTGSWVSLDIPLAKWPIDLTTIREFKVVGNGTVYFDNWYFYKQSTSTVTAPTDAPATPSFAETDVISIFSDAYTDLAATWNPGWGQTTVLEDEAIAGNAVKKYSTFTFTGIEPSAGTVDATAMTHINFDYWTSDATELKMKLVDYNGDGTWGTDNTEVEVVKSVSTGAWGTISIPFSEFTAINTAINFNDIGQLVLSATGATNPVYIDNIYFSNASALSTTSFLITDLSFYPNPTKNSLTISSKNSIDNAQIFNVLGKKVIDITINKSSKTIDVSNLASGIYLLKYSINNATGTAKFIKQ